MRREFSFLPLLALALVGCNQAGNNTTAPEAATGDVKPTTEQTTVTVRPTDATGAFVRGVHVVPGAGSFELRSEDTSLVSGFTFGNASPFVEVPLENAKGTKIDFTAFGAGNTKIAGPMPVTLGSGEDLTVVVNGVPGDIVLMPFKHKNHGPEEGKAKVAFLHAAKGLPSVDITVDGKSFRKAVKYAVVTDYAAFAPGRHTMKVDYVESLKPVAVPTPILSPEVQALVTPAPPVVVKPRQSVALTQEMDLAAGQVYSVIIFYDDKRLPKLRLLEDKFVPTLKDAPQK